MEVGRTAIWIPGRRGERKLIWLRESREIKFDGPPGEEAVDWGGAKSLSNGFVSRSLFTVTGAATECA